MKISHTDLTVEQKELLVCLAEKALEVDRLIDDILHPRLLPQGVEPASVHAELGDFLAVVERLVDLGLLSGGALDARVEQTLCNLENYVLFKNDIKVAG